MHNTGFGRAGARRRHGAAALNVVVDGAIFQAAGRGGISRVFRELLPRLCDLDDSLTISLLYESGALRQPLPEHARIRPTRLLRLRRFLRPGRLWNRLIPGGVRALEASLDSRIVGRGYGEVWHSTYFTLPPADWRGAKVVTVHDMIYERFPHLFDGSWLEGARARRERCIRSADAIIAISETTRSDLHQLYGIDPGSVRVVPHAHSTVFRRLEGEPMGSAPTPAGRPFLLYIGNRSHYKNFDTLLDAFARWPGRTETDLVAVGGGPWSEEERSRIAALSLDGRVHQLDGVPDEALCRLYNRADAFVYPSLYEGFGLPLLEAMACGCPIVASDIPSTREVAGDVARYFDPLDADSLLVALEGVGDPDPSGRVERGLERAARFSWDSAARATLSVYRDALALRVVP